MLWNVSRISSLAVWLSRIRQVRTSTRTAELLTTFPRLSRQASISEGEYVFQTLYYFMPALSQMSSAAISPIYETHQR